MATKKKTTTTETPIYEGVAAYLQPLLKSSERIGSVRALLMAGQWISQSLADGSLKATHEVKQIADALEQIRTDILLKNGSK